MELIQEIDSAAQPLLLFCAIPRLLLCAAGGRLSGSLALVAGLGVVTGALFELWEPTYAGNPTRLAVFFIRQWEVAIAAGLLASGVLGWSLADKTAPTPASTPSSAA